uniref:RRM domain-containing protein n=1 Tax=Dracunculus medinensis TaxID=318479 RepID=A0A0N4U947_DRAME
LRSPFGSTPQPLKQRDISFDTSSKEPHLIRARVFVGNINTNVITRDDIIRLFSSYGNLLGVTVFKGYAFIQYGTSTEADLAVGVLNGYNWNGSILGRIIFFLSSIFRGGVKRTADNWPNNVVKKEKLEDFSVVMAQNDRNRQTASEDITRNCNLYQTGMPDTLICGGCRFVTSDFEEFREHRKAACVTDLKDLKKERVN